MEFKVPAWCEVVEDFLEDGPVIFEAGYNGASVDIVKSVSEGPGVFRIVDFEAAIGWDAEGWILVVCLMEIVRMGEGQTNVVG